jgi:hypothetical protein
MVALTPYPRGIIMQTTRPRPLPTPDRAADLDRAFRAAVPIDEGPEFTFPEVYNALATAILNEASLADVICHELRHYITQRAPHQAEAIRRALDCVDAPTSEGPDWSYALAYAAYRMVDDAVIDPTYQPTGVEVMKLVRYLGGLTRLLGIPGVRITFTREIRLKP